MPITYHLKPDYRLIIIVHKGVIPDDELLSFYEAFSKEVPFDKTFNKLIDLRQEKGTNRSTKSLRKLARFMNLQFINSSVNLKFAVIATEDFYYGLARMTQAFSYNPSLEHGIFRTANDALKWLSVPENIMDDLTSS